MRKLIIAASLAALAGFTLTTPSAAASNGHWVCSETGIRSWTTDLAKTDAHGWKYDGADRTSYKDTGKCTRG